MRFSNQICINMYFYKIWRCMKAKGTPKKCVRIMKDMYERTVCERSAEEMKIELEKWKNALKKRVLRINRMKTRQLNFRIDKGQRVHLDPRWRGTECCGKIQVSGINGRQGMRTGL
uniref:Uncharacterized protein n=1 Tax=Cacopsylla melanoneura TaxID=428564 RepID=A0A8D8QBN1_9HEMI